MNDSKAKDNLLKIYNRLFDLKTKAKDGIVKLKYGVPKIMSMDETMDYILLHQCSVSRYGDGELKLAIGEDISFQKCTPEMRERLCEVLRSQSEDCLICVPDYFNGAKWMKDDSQEFMWRRAAQYRKQWSALLDMSRKYGNASISRCYYDWKDKSNCARWFEKMKKIWEGRDIVFVEGEESRLGYHNDLFDNAKSIKRILCPKLNAFLCYADIVNSVKRDVDTDKLVLIALGPTATVLAYDLSCFGYQAVDLGHIDIEYEWYRMGATEKVKIKDKYTNEANEEIYSLNKNDLDQDYNNQIIARIVPRFEI